MRIISIRTLHFCVKYQIHVSAKAHAKVANIGKDTLHQATNLLAKNKSTVVLENLNVSGMIRNHRPAQAIGDVGFYELKRQMQYKGEWYGCEVVLADRFYPSSKTCSNCGEDRRPAATQAGLIEAGTKQQTTHADVYVGF